MHVALDGQQTVLASGHRGQALPDELRLRKLVRPAQDPRERGRVRCEQPPAADKAAVDEGGAVVGDPLGDDIGVLLVGDGCKIAEEEGGGSGPWEETERRAGIVDEEGEEEDFEEEEAVVVAVVGQEEDRMLSSNLIDTQAFSLRKAKIACW